MLLTVKCKGCDRPIAFDPETQALERHVFRGSDGTVTEGRPRAMPFPTHCRPMAPPREPEQAGRPPQWLGAAGRGHFADHRWLKWSSATVFR